MAGMMQGDSRGFWYVKHECKAAGEFFSIEYMQIDGEWDWRLNVKTTGVNIIFSINHCPFCGWLCEVKT